MNSITKDECTNPSRCELGYLCPYCRNKAKGPNKPVINQFREKADREELVVLRELAAEIDIIKRNAGVPGRIGDLIHKWHVAASHCRCITGRDSGGKDHAAECWAHPNQRKLLK